MNEISGFHVLVGIFATMLGIVVGLSATVIAALVLVLGVAHEIYDGDLIKRAYGAPYEGVKDALSFLPAPFLYLALSHIC